MMKYLKTIKKVASRIRPEGVVRDSHLYVYHDNIYLKVACKTDDGPIHILKNGVLAHFAADLSIALPEPKNPEKIPPALITNIVRQPFDKYCGAGDLAHVYFDAKNQTAVACNRKILLAESIAIPFTTDFFIPKKGISIIEQLTTHGITHCYLEKNKNLYISGNDFLLVFEQPDINYPPYTAAIPQGTPQAFNGQRVLTALNALQPYVTDTISIVKGYLVAPDAKIKVWCGLPGAISLDPKQLRLGCKNFDRVICTGDAICLLSKSTTMVLARLRTAADEYILDTCTELKNDNEVF